MRWMRMALVSEGASDDAFLSVVLQRSAQQICPASTEVGDLGGFSVVVVHHDGASDPQDVRRRWVASLRERWWAAGHTEPVLGVVPVRETETRALADVDALRRLLGRTTRDSTFGLPSRGVELEKLPDPKRTLRALFERQHRWDPHYLVRLGELASLERLRELPAFQRWEDDLAEAIRTLPGFTKR